MVNPIFPAIDSGRLLIAAKNKIAATVGSTARTTFPGKTGYGGLDSLAKGMFQENQENENLEEEKLFTLSNDVKQLLESLVKKDDKHEAQ